MGKKNREKEQKHAEAEAAILAKLQVHNKNLPKRSERKRKKFTAEEIQQKYAYLNGLEGYYLRPPEVWEPKSHNPTRQVRDFVSHLFVKYHVPGFMFGVFDKSCDPNYDWHKDHRFVGRGYYYNRPPDIRQWFLAIAQGRSFQKEVKEYLNKNEAHTYLSAPDHYSPYENVWWVKMTCAGVNPNMIDVLMEKFFKHEFNYNRAQYKELINFFSRFQSQMDKRTAEEISDYLLHQFAQDNKWSLKGRTVGSVIKLSNDWHMLITKAGVNEFIEWKGMDTADWKFEDKEHTHWAVVQIKDNIALVKEGRKLGHCVYSYVSSCVKGFCSVFSLTRDDEKCLTIEVRSRSAVQIRGKYNREPTSYEKSVVRVWSRDRMISLGKF